MSTGLWCPIERGEARKGDRVRVTPKPGTGRVTRVNAAGERIHTYRWDDVQLERWVQVGDMPGDSPAGREEER